METIAERLDEKQFAELARKAGMPEDKIAGEIADALAEEKKTGFPAGYLLRDAFDVWTHPLETIPFMDEFLKARKNG
jgi:hypothetical protein